MFYDDDNSRKQYKNPGKGMDKKKVNAAQKDAKRIGSLIKSMSRKKDLTEEDYERMYELKTELNAVYNIITSEQDKEIKHLEYKDNEIERKTTHLEFKMYRVLTTLRKKAEQGNPEAIKSWKLQKPLYNKIIGSWIGKRGNN